MAVLTLEDMSGRFEAVLFAGRNNRRGEYEAGAYDRFADDCEEDLVAIFKGKVDDRKRRQRPQPTPTASEEGDGEPSADGAVEAQEEREELPSLIVSDVIPADLLNERLTKEVVLTLSKGKDITDPLEQTVTLLKENPGHCPLMFQIHTRAKSWSTSLPMNVGTCTR